jgi:hypothetical protein
MKRLRVSRPSPALIVSIVALVVALGGTSYAAFKVPKNSVGSKQLKKNAVTTKKIKNHAVTASKINTSGLTVPSATHANTADNAGTAANIAAPEGFHIVGQPSGPPFQNGCSDITSVPLQPVGFFKDKEGIVHLQGAFQCPAEGDVAFQLPAGYQPTGGTALVEAGSGGSAQLIISGGFTSGTTTLPPGAVAPS